MRYDVKKQIEMINNAVEILGLTEISNMRQPTEEELHEAYKVATACMTLVINALVMKDATMKELRDGLKSEDADCVEKSAECGDLGEKEQSLKNPLELKESILGRMQEFVDEYRRYLGRYNYFGGMADGLEMSMRLVKAAFCDAMDESAGRGK